MEKKNRTMLILGVILLIAMMAGQEKKEAVVVKYVNPGVSVALEAGELVVKETATSWTPGPPSKVHYWICKVSDCSQPTDSNVVSQGFHTLTTTEINDLNTRLTSQFKTARYDLSFTTPSQEGYYWYKARAETSTGLEAVSIYPDFGLTPNSHQFYVTSSSIPCAERTIQENVAISHGTIVVTVSIVQTGNEPNCAESSRNDIGFNVICDPSYTSNVDGRQSTCTLASSCTDNDGGQNYLQKGDVSVIGSTGTITTHDTCLNDGITVVEQYCSGNNNLESTKNCKDYGATWACSDAKCVNTGIICAVDQNSWSPNPSTVCQGTAFIQTSNCNTTKMNVGTSTSGSCETPSHLACVNNACTLVNGTGTNECATIGTACGTATSWSPLTSSKACGTSFTQISNIGTEKAATGIACESGTCNLETAECEEDEEFDFNKYIPFLIIFFAVIIGMKLMKQK